MPAKKSVESTIQQGITYPLIPLRDVVIYPFMVVPLFIGRKLSIKAIEVAQAQKTDIFLVTQKDSEIDLPKRKDLYDMGCVVNILQMLKLPDGTVKVLVEGVRRAKLDKLKKQAGGLLVAEVSPIEPGVIDPTDSEVGILMRTVKAAFESFIKENKRIPLEIMSPIENIKDADRLADTIAAHLPIDIDKKQALLAAPDAVKRLEKLLKLIETEIDFIQVEKRVKGRVKRQMEKSQREYYLNEQIKAIQSELGELGEGSSEQDELLKKIHEAKMSKEAEEKCLSELSKLKLMQPMSAEATVSRNYLEMVISLPWNKQSSLNKSLNKAHDSLESAHYGLEKVKERIIEYLAVQKRVKKIKGPVLCLVGPPGVGKTSLGASIAEATGRKLLKISLGGVRDEAEIRGHRRTYIGAMPGKIIQKIAKSGVNNPLILLDEIDKMAMDFRGDPASALLEVLDPEQNNRFSDHYLEVDYDLSNVLFLATANTADIPDALLDRMEVIYLSGYTEDEKTHIAMNYLLPKQIKASGLKANEIAFNEASIRSIVRYYSREAGVRQLEREIAKVCRKTVTEILLSKKDKKSQAMVKITPDTLEHYLGVKKYRYGVAETFNQVGQVTGLAWTSVGGELLTIEATAVKGKGAAQYTGSLGSVMQESIQAAITVVKSRSDIFDIESEYFNAHNLHIHVPEGATPKDGPSAGIGMCTALVSAITGLAVKSTVAMTGEITLRGEVLPIGGLKEKLLAAHRGGITCVIIPEENRKDLQEIPENVKANLEIVPVKWIDEVLSLALVNYLELIRPPVKKKTRATKPGKKTKTRRQSTTH